MSAQFKTLLTEFGAAKLAEIQATNAALNLHSMAVGDGGGQAVEPSSSQTSLVNETHRAQINTLAQDSNNDSYYIAELVVPADVGGWYVREIGLYDNNGNLFAVGNVPETYKPLLSSGSSRDQVFRMIIEIGSNANVTLKIDPAMVLATRSYVDMRDSEVKDIALQSAPPGFIGEFARETAPAGWLKANGTAVSRTLYAKLFAAIGTKYGAGDGSTTFNLPDARGLFPRAWDDGKGIDSGREIGSVQDDAIRNITGQLNVYAVENTGTGAFRTGTYVGSIQSGDGGRYKLSFDASRIVPTAEENRPKNIAWLVCIKY